MAADLTAFGDWLAVPSVVCLWIAVLLRAPGALRSPSSAACGWPSPPLPPR